MVLGFANFSKNGRPAYIPIAYPPREPKTLKIVAVSTMAKISVTEP